MLESKLDCVNLILRELGEPPLSSLETQYPTLDLILPALEDGRTQLLQSGWWFNTFYGITLAANADGTVTMPSDTLMFYPRDPHVLLIGDTLYNADGTLWTGGAVVGDRILDLDLLTLPLSARYYVVYYAASNVYAADVGYDNIYQKLIMQATGYRGELTSQHSRARKFNSRNRKQMARMYSSMRT